MCWEHCAGLHGPPCYRHDDAGSIFLLLCSHVFKTIIAYSGLVFLLQARWGPCLLLARWSCSTACLPPRSPRKLDRSALLSLELIGPLFRFFAYINIGSGGFNLCNNGLLSIWYSLTRLVLMVLREQRSTLRTEISRTTWNQGLNLLIWGFIQKVVFSENFHDWVLNVK